MNVLSDNLLKGDLINLKVSKNIGSSVNENKTKIDPMTDSFSDLFQKALNQTNELELKSSALTSQLAINPESVNIHDVQIASEEAEMAVLLTKGILDRVIRAYREIINLR
jgi:flagellar hook-basal body complex protein FliE